MPVMTRLTSRMLPRWPARRGALNTWSFIGLMLADGDAGGLGAGEVGLLAKHAPAASPVHAHDFAGVGCGRGVIVKGSGDDVALADGEVEPVAFLQEHGGGAILDPAERPGGWAVDIAKG